MKQILMEHIENERIRKVVSKFIKIYFFIYSALFWINHLKFWRSSSESDSQSDENFDNAGDYYGSLHISKIASGFVNKKTFECPRVKTTLHTGDNVANLSPEDINIIAALGDSLAVSYFALKFTGFCWITSSNILLFLYIWYISCNSFNNKGENIPKKKIFVFFFLQFCYYHKFAFNLNFWYQDHWRKVEIYLFRIVLANIIHRI